MIDKPLDFQKMAHLGMDKPVADTQTHKFNFFEHIPPELQPELDDYIARENATRIVYAFAVAGLTHLARLWVDMQRMQLGLFEIEPAYRWIFYSDLAWWLITCIPIHFALHLRRIRQGQYPTRRLQILGNAIILLACLFALNTAAIHFKINHGLGFYAVVLISVSIFIMPFKMRFAVLLVSTVVMCATVFKQTDLTLIQAKFWLISIIAITLIVFVCSFFWYNGMVRQFLNVKMLAAQKKILAEQAELLVAQNQVIEHDKTRLTEQLDALQRQLNGSALRLAKSANFLESLKTDLKSVNPLDEEDSKKKKQLLRKIDRENTRESDWAQFREQFELVHPGFFAAVLAQFPTLTASDVRLMSLLKMNLETKEIVSILGISAQSVNTARYRLRKNLELVSEDGLSEFVHRFT